ncbi:4Fe-4S binding protein [Candidatus Acetothermia bacterium]|jgi:ferredoxin|nr:4Fe-4S binding protein [Candidatus Acetothermia bacterium]MCI2431536.1 4Fe-4S binding protein [Candidatus Acetothermia bacterium]MCI2436206.1 4Fe-4S binding protein [Candidatus Acetothermia bacterium]
MAFVICQPCLGVKSGDCVQVCPVDCIHPRKDEPDFANVQQIFIDPVTCINCGACAAVCPVQAIFPEEDVPEQWKQYIQINAQYYKK